MKNYYLFLFALNINCSKILINLNESFSKNCGLFPMSSKNKFLKQGPGMPNKSFNIRHKNFYVDKSKLKKPIFYILVHGSYMTVFDGLEPKCLWGEIEFTDKIPPGLLDNPDYDNKEAIRLAFGWSGRLSKTARKTGGIQLAKGIIQLRKQFPNAKFILCGHSHGGNIINIASKEIYKHKAWNNPIDIVIQLATPIMKPNKKFLYKPKNINYIFNYYSMQDFIQTNAPQSRGKRRYKPIKQITIYNCRLLNNGQDPPHIKMHNRAIGSRILQLSQKIKSEFPKIHNLVANIDKDTTVNFLIAPRMHKRKKGEVTGTDIYWEKVEPENYQTKLYKQHLLAKANKQFKLKYNKNIDKRLDKFSKLIKTIKNFLQTTFSQKYEHIYGRKIRHKKIKQDVKILRFYD